MKKVAVIFVAIVLCLFLQSAIFGTYLPREIVPNLCLVLIVFLGVYEASVLGAVLAFLIGLSLDISSGQTLGPWSGAFSALFGILSQGGKRMFLDSGLMIAVMVFASALFGSVVYLFLLSKFRLSFSDVFSLTFFGTSFTTALLSPIVFSTLRRFWERKLHSRYL